MRPFRDVAGAIAAIVVARSSRSSWRGVVSRWGGVYRRGEAVALVDRFWRVLQTRLLINAGTIHGCNCFAPTHVVGMAASIARPPHRRGGDMHRHAAPQSKPLRITHYASRRNIPRTQRIGAASM